MLQRLSREIVSILASTSPGPGSSHRRGSFGCAPGAPETIVAQAFATVPTFFGRQGVGVRVALEAVVGWGRGALGGEEKVHSVVSAGA